MILLEITAEKSQTYYEVLGLEQKDIQAMSEREATKSIIKAAKNISRPYKKEANRGDSDAEAMLSKIGEALDRIKKLEDRIKYNESLQSGEVGGSELFRIQNCAPPFFWERKSRYRTIEQLMRQAKLSTPLPFHNEVNNNQG